MEQNIVKYTLLFPEFSDMHIGKDVGMIPFFLQRTYGWKCTIASYNNGEEVAEKLFEKNIDYKQISRISKSSVLNGFLYLMTNSKSIDVLHLFHAHYRRTFFYILFYSIFNPEGKIYLKLDAPEYLYNDYDDMGVISRVIHKMKCRILKKCTLISVESNQLVDKIEKYFNVAVKCIPNGYYWDSFVRNNDVKKEDCFLTVGRLNADEKNIPLLIDAFLEYRTLHCGKWRLVLVGPGHEDIILLLNDPKYDEIRKYVDLKGSKTSKEVFEECEKCKCFVLPSKTEAFPLCLTEAVSVGCYVLVSDRVTSRNIITDNGNLGLIVKTNDVHELAKGMKSISDNGKLNELAKKIEKRAKEVFQWEKIIGQIYDGLDVDPRGNRVEKRI